MELFFIILGSVILLIIIFFQIPYSPIKTKFKTLTTNLIQPTNIEARFTEELISHLPKPLINYIKYCGYIGTPIMNHMKIDFKDVDFILGQKKIKIDYKQYNFVNNPIRYALIDTKMMGIPFEGLDSYHQGKGRMLGKLGKLITIFDQKDESMNKAALVTFLAECLFIPSCILKDYITWEEIDSTHVKATITDSNISACGIFTFNENGEMIAFSTNDRESVDMNGTKRNAKWEAICSEYADFDGIKHPTVLKAVWHYPEGDLIYFNSNNFNISYK